MKTLFYAVTLAIATLYVTEGHAQSPALTVNVEGIDKDSFIEPEFAFCAPASAGHMQDGQNKSLGVSWSSGPSGTKSYAIIMVDKDVPTNFEDAGKEGKTISSKMARKDFYHWVLLDIPAEKSMIPAYTDSQTIVKHGKSVLTTPYGFRGVNDYGPYFASNPDRQGVYAGYDGPCPPWNDELVHHYHIKVFALDVGSLGFSDVVTGPEAMEAINKHILAQGEVVGKYTLNSSLKK